MVNAMQQAEAGQAPDAELAQLPPRERILAAARDLFYRHGIKAVGVESIADAAGTNKMTLYRHFASKDELVAACLKQLAEKDEARWQALAAAHPGDPKGHLLGWLALLQDGMLSAGPGERGCPFANAAVELPDREHPARRVVEAHKNARCRSILELCRSGGFDDPDRLADEIFLLLEGAFSSLQSMGPQGPASRIVAMAQAMIADHEARNRS
jgi:AcrR family transcriptional regulator